MLYSRYRLKPIARSFYAVCVWLTVAPLAAAQTVDYSALETLFGEPVTTSATGKPQRSSDVPVGLDIVTADQIRRMGVTSLPEILARLPGMTSWQATRSFADVGVRGQNTAYNSTLLVLVNGRQVYTDSYGFTDWSLIPVQLEEIRQIEVVKGPATALYGFNAVSGVVNIITHNPKYDATDKAGIVGGTGDYRRAYGIKTLKVSDDASVRLSASKEQFNEFSKHSKTRYVTPSTFQDGDSDRIAADGLIQLSDKTQLRLETSYAQTEGSDAVGVYYAAATSKSFASGKASLTSETGIGLVEANLYTNIYENNISSSNAVSDSTVDNQITVLQLQDLFKVGSDHTLRLSGEYRHNSLESDVLVMPNTEVYYDVVSGGAMWNWAMTPELEWTNAVRIDKLMLSRDGPIPAASPYLSNDAFDQTIVDYGVNSGFVWKATQYDTFRTAYGRGIQAPSLFGFGAFFPIGANAYSIGNPYQGTTVVDNYELGYDRNIAALGGKFTSTLFYKKTSDISSISGSSFVSGPNFYSVTDMIGDSSTTGVELGLSGTISEAWSWDTSYMYQNTVDEFTPAASTNPSIAPLHYEDTVPHHVLKAHLGYASGPWETDLYGEAGSSFNAVSMVGGGGGYRVTGLDGYNTLGARIAYQFENDITLALMGSDLSHARVANNYGLENERRAFVSLSKKF